MEYAPTEYTLKLTYRGGLADQHRMDGADGPVATDGAKQVMAALAYAYCLGDVPRNKLTDTKYFYIHQLEAGSGCFVSAIVTGIIGSTIYKVREYTFLEYAIPAFKAWERGLLFEEPEFIRIEPVLQPLDQLNAPVFDRQCQQKKLAADMSRALDGGMARVTRTLGRYADSVEMELGGYPLGRFDRRYRATSTTEAEIEVAVRRIRANIDRQQLH